MPKDINKVTISDLPQEVQKAIASLNNKIKSKNLGLITDEHIRRELREEGQKIIQEYGDPNSTKYHNLVRPDAGKVNSNAKKAAQLLVDDCIKACGKPKGQYVAGVKSDYRSYSTQVDNFANKVGSNEGGGVRNVDAVHKANTIPGYSQHHTGRGIDIFSVSSSFWSSNPKHRDWVKDNCEKYGFRLSYPVAGPLRIYEPWHLYYFKDGEVNPVNQQTNDKSNIEDQTKPNQTENDPAKTNTTVTSPTTQEKKEVQFSNGRIVKSTPKKDITGKATLKVKSGPGVIIGTTEVDIVEGIVKFSDIEFNEPGDYVITIMTTSTEVNEGEFKVKVLPEIVNSEQPPSDKQDQKPVEGSRPIISQVDSPKVNLPPMEFDRTNSGDDKKVASQIGLTPFINYMGYQIDDRDINYLNLYHDGIIPSVQFTFFDAKNIIKSVGMPQDDTKFELFLNSKSQNLKSIHLKFKIEDFSDNKNGKYTITGTLDIPELYRIDYKSYTGTSLEVLRNISNELKLGFNTNIVNTDDSMIWRNVGEKNYVFMSNIIRHSYLSDESFMTGFIDYYYCFNYVDVEKELKRDNSKDLCIDTGNIEDGKTTDVEKLVPLILINETAMQSSNMRIIEKRFENNSTSISLQSGYKKQTKFYDKTKKMFLIFDVDSQTSDESTSMILKGAKGDKESFDNHYTTTYSGKIDTDNVHKNYNYALTQNSINYRELNKIVLTVDMPNPNFSIYLYQKIKVSIINKEPATETNKEQVQWRKSGDYIISEINFIWNGKSLSQELVLLRRELGKNPEEIKEGPPPSPNALQEVKNPNNENPVTEEVKNNPNISETQPNSKYTVGDTYTVVNSDGKRFILTITNVLPNGTEVSAKITEIIF